MRRLSILILALTASACAASRPPVHAGPPRPGGEGVPPRFLFISPMGEPFRTERPDKAWFDGADANHDGKLDRAEFRADAARFFRVLDRQHDGEIDPDDIDVYENQLAPEIRVRDQAGGSFGGRSGGRRPGGGGGRRGGGRRGGSGGGGSRDGGSGGGATERAAAPPEGQGAGRYGYLTLPEPVTAADRNFNRGIDPGEFADAADTRFAQLDRNGDGVLTANELPAVNTRLHGGRQDFPSRPARPPGYQPGRDRSDDAGGDTGGR